MSCDTYMVRVGVMYTAGGVVVLQHGLEQPCNLLRECDAVFETADVQ